MIDENSTLEEVCFAVAGALRAASIEATLTGGSAATMYAPEVCTSFDADFVFERAPKSPQLARALAAIGYRASASAGMFEHPKSKFTLDFPKGPLAVGRDYVTVVATLKRGNDVLKILTPTDCVKDRLAHYFFWNDETALAAAVAVAMTRSAEINYAELQAWTERESRDSTDYRPKLQVFLAKVGSNDSGRQ